MPRTVKEPRQRITKRLKPSLINLVQKEAKKHGITATEIFEKGIEMYIDYLNNKEV